MGAQDVWHKQEAAFLKPLLCTGLEEESPESACNPYKMPHSPPYPHGLDTLAYNSFPLFPVLGGLGCSPFQGESYKSWSVQYVNNLLLGANSRPRVITETEEKHLPLSIGQW